MISNIEIKTQTAYAYKRVPKIMKFCIRNNFSFFGY